MIRLADNKNPYIQPDLYSCSERIVGEIHAHIGKLKVGQRHKLANDILKMLLLEKNERQPFRKLLIVCDAVVLNELQSTSFLAESIRQFNIELVCVALDEATRDQVLLAQKRQKMVNE